VAPKLEASSAAEVVTLSKKLPNGLSYSNVGAAGLVTYSAEIFRVQTGAKLVGVPYRGGALATTAVVSGEVHLTFANMSDAMGQLEAKTVRPLAVTTAKRSEFLPSIPTLIEERLVEYPIESWNALFAPTGTAASIVDKLAKTMQDMSRDPESRRTMAQFGSTSVSSTPRQFAEMLRNETSQWEPVEKHRRGGSALPCRGDPWRLLVVAPFLRAGGLDAGQGHRPASCPCSWPREKR
jgi:tripartite-type tricarboxylate transporter receptor subunit TctC